MPRHRDEARLARVVQLYKTGLSCREVGIRVGMSMQRVHAIIKQEAPEAMREAHRGASLTPAERREAHAAKLLAPTISTDN